MGETILKCENLNKKFGRKQILENVSFEVNQGDILGFIRTKWGRKDNNNKVSIRTSKYRSWKGDNKWIGCRKTIYKSN